MGSGSGIDGPASIAHCFYCFEVLAANYDERNPPPLAKVVQLWEEYEAAQITSHDTRHATPSVDRDQAVSPASQNTSTTASSGSSRTTADSSSSSLSLASTSLLSAISASYPMFVTWNTLSSRGKSLRGCIGNFTPLPLEEGLKTYSLVSALEDNRFSPISASLIPQLGCELTLLADFQPCQDAMDWTIGTHGLKISFGWRGRRYGATYLPHVCPEQGWTKEECLESLMQKAGWEPERRGAGGIAKRILGGGSEADQAEKSGKPWEQVQEMNVVRYTGFHGAATYKEWTDWRAWAKGRI